MRYLGSLLLFLVTISCFAHSNNDFGSASLESYAPSDTTYSGNLSARVWSKKKIILEGYILPKHISSLIKEKLSEKDAGRYMVNYTIVEENGTIVTQNIAIKNFVNNTIYIRNDTNQNLYKSEELGDKSYVDLGIGIGPNYGIMGAKMVLGPNGSGLMLGIGRFDGFTASSIGIQVKFSCVFVNASYAAYGSYRSVGGGQMKSDLIRGIVLMTGVQANLVQRKLFFEFGVGYAQGGETLDPFGRTLEEVNTVTFGLGLVYRFGK